MFKIKLGSIIIKHLEKYNLNHTYYIIKKLQLQQKICNKNVIIIKLLKTAISKKYLKNCCICNRKRKKLIYNKHISERRECGKNENN